MRLDDRKDPWWREENVWFISDPKDWNFDEERKQPPLWLPALLCIMMFVMGGLTWAVVEQWLRS